MATLPPSTLQLPKPNLTFPSSPRPHHPLIKLHAPPRAAPEDSSSSAPTSSEPAPASAQEEDSFESRLSKIRLRNRSGLGKKAEERKSRKQKKTGSSSGSNVFLPPVPLKEPVSEGVKVEFGFSPYSERVNGRIAMLGLTALFLVELATGQGVLNYHTPSIVFIQIYFVAAVSAIYVKFEKEKISVWPLSDK